MHETFGKKYGYAYLYYGGIIGHDDSCSRVPGAFVKLQEKTVELFRNNSREPRQ